jgi:hypothetical protein
LKGLKFGRKIHLLHFQVDANSIAVNEQLTHAEFVVRFERNPNAFRVNWVSAFYAQRLLPWNYRLAWACLSVLEWGSLLGGLALIIFRHWLIGLCAIVFCIGIVMPASRKTACQFILEYSVENEEFWRVMSGKGVLSEATDSHLPP